MSWNPNAALIPYQPINFQQEVYKYNENINFQQEDFKKTIETLDKELEVHKPIARQRTERFIVTTIICSQQNLNKHTTAQEIIAIKKIQLSILGLCENFNSVYSGYSSERFKPEIRINKKKIKTLQMKCDNYLKEHEKILKIQEKLNR